MTDATKVTDKLVKTKLADYSTEPKPKPVQTPDLFASGRRQPSTRKTKTYSPKPVTSAADYARKYPAIQTPSALSKAKVDQLLLDCRELPTPDKPQKNYAGYSRDEWDRLLAVVARYTADVCEGAGLHYKGNMAVEHFRKGLSILLQESFMHHDPYDKRNRFISVDGRIDTDERKP